MRWAVRIVASTFLLAVVSSHAQQRAATAPSEAGESRIALVIGNSNYKDMPLANPVNDARALAKLLNQIGFQVKLRTNLTQSQMRQSIREFGDELHAKQGVGLFYFAGHGVQISNRNFLIPVGTDIQREYEVEDQAVDAGTVLMMMQSAKARMNIVILDACRNNPFMRNFRSAINGLAPMQAPAGTVVAFSTAPGETAIDGSGQNGLYTQYLLENINVPGLRIEDVFKNVRVGVRRDSDGKQTPWENTSLEGDFYFKAPVASAAGDSKIQQEAIERSVQAALKKREEEEAVQRKAQQDEIERAVAAALRKREADLEAAQAAKVEQETLAAKASIERLTKELAELRATAKVTAESAVPPQLPAGPAVSSLPKAPASSPTQLALAVLPPRPQPVIEVGGRVERPDIRVGDQWTYQVTDDFTKAKRTVAMGVVRVTENYIYTQSAPASLAALDLSSTGGLPDLWDRNWNQLRQGDREYSPFYPSLQFPLDSNKNWSGTVSIDVGGGDKLVHKLMARVVGWERVTVPAGTFDSVRINLRGDYQVQSTRMSGGGAINDVVWYAPAIRQIIKKEIQQRGFSGGSFNIAGRYEQLEHWELVEYKLN